MATQYFVDAQPQPPALLRRTDTADEVFRDGQWIPTKTIIDWTFGNDDFVDPVSETQAREIAPEAFTTSRP